MGPFMSSDQQFEKDLKFVIFILLSILAVVLASLSCLELTNEEHLVKEYELEIDTTMRNNIFTNLNTNKFPNVEYRKEIRPICGLRGEGVFCYFNTVIQLLFSMQDFCKLMFLKTTEDQKLLKILQRIYFKMIHGKTFICSKHFNEIKKLISTNVDLSQQQDFDEFLKFIINSTVKELEYFENKEILNFFKESYEILSKNEYFCLEHEQVIKTEANIKKDQYTIDINLSDNTSDEQIPNNIYLNMNNLYSIDSDNNHRNTESQCFNNNSVVVEEITNNPKYILMNVREFRDPNSLIGPLLKRNVKIVNSIKINGFKYILQSVVIHEGSKPTSGHYYMITNRRGKAFTFNDTEKSISDKYK